MAAAKPSTAGPVYPANAVATMPGPRGFPDDTVTPDVSLCNRMPDSLRPTNAATSACEPSCACVITWRVFSHSGRTVTRINAIAAVITTSAVDAGSSTAETACHADSTVFVNESSSTPLITFRRVQVRHDTLSAPLAS